MKSRLAVVYIVLLAGAPATAASRAEMQQRHELVRAWQRLFRPLRTVECTWVSHRTDGRAPAQRHHLRIAGRRFRNAFSPATLPPPRGTMQSVVNTFDGTNYRKLDIYDAKTSEYRLSPRATLREYPYGATPPFLQAFDFVFGARDIQTLDTLRQPGLWQRFMPRITSLRRGTWQGRRGQWLVVASVTPGISPANIFVESGSHMPVYFRATMHHARSRTDYNTATFEWRITRRFRWRGNSYPLRMEGRQWYKDVKDGAASWSTERMTDYVTGPVRFNRAMPTARLGIAIPTGAYVDYNPRALHWRQVHGFRYDPHGGSLWAQEQRAGQRIAAARRRLAAMPKVYDEKADGAADIAAALQTAQAGNKRVLLMFGGNWCAPCHTLHRLFHRSTAIATVLRQSFVVVNIDVTHNAAVYKQYRGADQEGVPFLVVLENDGRRLANPPSESFAKSAYDDRFDPHKIEAFLKKWAPAVASG